MNTKECYGCKKVKSASEFQKHAGQKDGLQSKCRVCNNAHNRKYNSSQERKKEIKEYQNLVDSKERQKEYMKRYSSSPNRKARKADLNRWSTLKRKYGLSKSNWMLLLKSQNGRCAICETGNPTRGVWTVDHDHNCCKGSHTCGNCVRAILCNDCNTGIGFLKDDSSILLKAVNYLESYKQ